MPSNVDVEVKGSVFLGSVGTKGSRARLDWLRQAREGLAGRKPEAEEDDERPLLSVDCSGIMGSVG